MTTGAQVHSVDDILRTVDLLPAHNFATYDDYLAYKELMKPPKSGPCMYLFRMGDVYKIGYTTNLRRRLETLDAPQLPYEAELVIALIRPDAKRIETDLHHRFADKRLRGEWFALDADDVEYIVGLAGVS